ncbi:hypothetical protein WA026_000008 [Henosepilachna vigintioctopunctata]|uniref:Nucleolar complex protein 2 homolog n=1 Tax=Henosepilachna vigintioctopunctata TaxID=420089 RepID=A0AAW1V682_9CUCU
MKRVISKRQKFPKKLNGKGKKSVKVDSSKYDTMSVDDFMSKSFDKDTDSETSEVENTEEDLSSEQSCEVSTEEDEDSDETNFDENSVEKHKQSLEKLKETDPEFYKFLEENDRKILNFNISDDEEDDGEESNLHVPDDDLDVASDDSDYEGENDEAPKDNKTITLNLLKKWQSNIKSDKTNKTLNNLSEAFHAALLSVLHDENAKECSFKVEGSSVFNAVIQLCVLEFGPAMRRFLKLSPDSKLQPHKCKRFVKVKNILKLYFENLLKLLTTVASPNIQTILLKHLHYMSSMLISFPHSSKSIIKQLIRIWGTAEEGVRIIAFFCILRITRNNQMALLDTVLKSMYMTYVKNSKFVSVSSLATINFMRRSLVEMFALDLNVTYQHVFVYIRQLAIHLRNAITVTKQENRQAVYNWQFINSLKLWGSLLGLTSENSQMKQLVYPLVQICLGTIRLVPTTQYYPLRFHVTQILMDLSRETGVYIPVLPFLIDILLDYDFNRKHSKVSMKPMQFTCILRLSKSQLGENGFKDTLIDTVYSQLLEYLSQQSSSIAFNELSFICIVRIKTFLKKCKNANFSRKMKQLLDKIEQNVKFIDNEKKNFTFQLTEFKKIEGLESQIRNKGTPLSIFHESWSKVRNQKKRKDITNNDEMGDYKLPVLNKSNISAVKRKKNGTKEGPVELFPSDSDEEMETSVKKRRGTRGARNKGNLHEAVHGDTIDDGGKEDIIQDIDVNDW